MSTNVQIGVIATRANTIAIPQGGTGPDADDILLARNNLIGGPGTTGPNGGGLGAGGEGGVVLAEVLKRKDYLLEIRQII